MGKSYSLDLHERIVAHVAVAASRQAATRHFGVSASSAIKLVKREAHRAFLIEQVEARPDITLRELAERLEAERVGKISRRP